jgi:hypothetical protein
MSLLLTLVALAAAVFSYVKWGRPLAAKAYPDFYSNLDAIEAGLLTRACAKARKFWEVTVGIALIVGPEVPDVLTELGSVDLTGILPDETVKLISKVVGLALVAIRVARIMSAAKV